MTTITKFTTPAAAGTEVHTRAERHMSAKGGTYQEAVHAILAADPDLAQAYAQPATRVADTRSQPAVPVGDREELEIKDWIMRALQDDMVGSLPDALGNLSIEADKFKKIGMPIEEAARRAMDENPHLMPMAKLLLADMRRNAPGAKPANDDKDAVAPLAQGQTPGEIIHLRAQALTDKHPHLSYSAALHQVLDDDEELKKNYARS